MVKEFGVLPYAGGLYDQDPDTIEDFQIISGEIAKAEKAEVDRQRRR
jgi:hypothetical protein